ncbi:unnamed protein product [Linum tenue]|uniref:Uncharacterized protein n=1 Tax=Linum tenue TaxID=586396 RepID=A0AAV0RE72_9ROSI|nr:unnamed protein product [Linum tenue]
MDFFAIRIHLKQWTSFLRWFLKVSQLMQPRCLCY